MSKKLQTENHLAKYQWVLCGTGSALLVIGILTSIFVNMILGLASTVGALGWFGLCLMISPQVRQDLFGVRFEKVDTVRTTDEGRQCDNGIGETRQS